EPHRADELRARYVPDTNCLVSSDRHKTLRSRGEEQAPDRGDMSERRNVGVQVLPGGNVPAAEDRVVGYDGPPVGGERAAAWLVGHRPAVNDFPGLEVPEHVIAVRGKQELGPVRRDGEMPGVADGRRLEPVGFLAGRGVPDVPLMLAAAGGGDQV